MPASLILRDIRKSYGSTEIIRGIDLTVAPGEFVALVGPSGCGKSTLLRMIAGLEEITSGELRFDDSVVNDWDPARRRVGMVFQSYALYPHMTVEQNVGFGLKLAGTPPAELAARVDQALHVLQLTALRKHRPSQLSGGQRQRVAIGRAIVRNPNVFLFDEPLSNLDAALRGQMRLEIGKLHQQLKNTVIYVTHDQVEAMTLADRIVVLEGGLVRQVGRPMDLYEHPANRFVAGFIGTPTMGFLAGQVTAAGSGGMAVALDGAAGRVVTVPARAASPAVGAAVTLGVRPEHCTVCPVDQAVLPGTVVMLERLGADTFAFLDVPGAPAPIAVRLGGADAGVAPGQRVGLRFDSDRAHVFADDGTALAKAAPSTDRVTAPAMIPASASPAVPPLGSEPFRPQFHFTARRNWINDPNGLVWFDGEYHLFFQHNPHGIDWGHMSWGHAVSTDLLHWRELAVAIPESDHMIFSGSVVVDRDNVSGLGDGRTPPMLAFYTAYHPGSEIQAQHLAVSQDRGRTFTAYALNPVIDLGATDFRDPKVFWHAPSGAWIMAAVLARRQVVQFYRSANLRDWVLAGEFGGHGAVAGQWECPDLIQVGVDGDDRQAHWVLKVDVDTGLLAGGSGAQYFVGAFDGHRFVLDPQRGNPAGDPVDCGPDFYAAVTWGDLPPDQPGPVWIGWQSNHQSGKAYPTMPWRGALSLPRQVFLFEEAGRWRLGQRLIGALDDLRQAGTMLPPVTLDDGDQTVVPLPGAGFSQSLRLIDRGAGRIALTLHDHDHALLTMTFDLPAGTIAFDRHASAVCPQDSFARLTTTQMPASGAVDLTIVCDAGLVEIVIAGGRRIWTGVVFPPGPLHLVMRATAGTARVEAIAGWTLRRSIDFVT